MHRAGYKASYLDTFLHPQEGAKYIDKAIKILSKYDDQYDSIAFMGMSGALFGPELSRRLNKHLIMVRKSTNDTHSSSLVEGYYKGKNYIIVDDFIASGKTVRNIRKRIKKFNPKAKCVGILEIDHIRGSRGINKLNIDTIYLYLEHLEDE
jgi:adenine/guanine phosphoribosyltransferase-like PRPP-binding protein